MLTKDVERIRAETTAIRDTSNAMYEMLFTMQAEKLHRIANHMAIAIGDGRVGHYIASNNQYSLRCFYDNFENWIHAVGNCVDSFCACRRPGGE